MSDLDLDPIQQRTLSGEAADRLRMAIKNSLLPAGTRLVEQDVAARLGMSRIPVREAIQKLVEEGLVRKIPHRGAFVYLPSRSEIEEISSLRVVLERFVAERVIDRWTPHHAANLRRIVAVMRQAAAQASFQQVFEGDYEFHYALWEIAQHSILLELVSSLRSRISRFLYEATGALPATQLDEHVAGHDDLIDVFTQGDPMAAKDAITSHILGAKERILAYCILTDDE